MPAWKPAVLAGLTDHRTLPAVTDGGLTRRRALGLGAVAGFGALLARPLPALGRGTAAPRAFGLTVTAADFAGGAGVSRVLRTRRRFDLAGLRAARGDVEMRVRRADGGWSPWVALAVRGDHAPDTGSGERASDPVWTGGSRELQLRVGRRLADPLRLHLVAVPASARKHVRPQPVARAAQDSAIPAPPPIIPRSAWGADQVPPRAAPSYGVVQMGFVHHTVNANSYSKADSAAIVLAIAKYHRDTNGWNDIGYNFVVDQYGQIFEGRGGGIDQAVIGAQAQGYNSNSTGVAVIGTYESVGMSAAALDAVARVLGWKLSRHGVPVAGTVVIESLGGDANRYPAGRMVTFNRISGHRDGCTTSCPGASAYGQLAAIRSRAQRYTFALPTGTVAQVSLVAEAPTVKYDQQARLSGLVLRGDGTPAAGEPVVVQRRAGTGWTTLGQATPDATGAWELSLAWRATAEVRAVAGGVSSPSTTIACRPTLTRGRVTRQVAAGGKVRVGGDVKPAVAVYVLVERRQNGRWRRANVVRAKVRSGRYDAAVRFATPGTYRLTVKAGTPGANAIARRASVKVVRRSAGRASSKKSSTAPKPTTTGGVGAT
jgi:hypothetical protein